MKISRLKKQKVLISLSSQGLAAIKNYESKELFIINVGNTKYRIPKLIAIFISPAIARMLENDPEINRFDINIQDDQKVFRVLIQLAFGNSVNVEPSQIPLLIAFGKALENEELIDACKLSAQSEDEVTIENAVSMLINKKKQRAKYNYIIEFIASHINEVINRGMEKLDANDIQKILTHGKFRTKSDAAIFRFIFDLYMEHTDDPRYSELFACVNFQNLDEEDMSNFVNNVSSNQITDGIWRALSRRLILPVVPDKQNRQAAQFTEISRSSSRLPSPPPEIQESRKSTRSFEFNGSDYYHGVFENLRMKKKHVIMSSSSTNTGTITSLISPTNKTNFWTGNQVDSWIKVELKKNKVIPTSYTIRGRYDHDFNQPQSWNFEAFFDGKWEILDSHVNDPLRVKEPRNFKVSTKTKYSAFRIKQTGPNTYGDHDLVLSAFEVFGEVF